MRKSKFIVIESDNAESVIANGIQNDCEQQLDCDYIKDFKKDREGDIPTRYEVTVTVKKIGRLKDT